MAQEHKYDRTKLLDLLSRRFEEEELKTLCFTRQVDYDDLPGEGKSGKARELVEYFDRREQLDQLAEAMHTLRPDVDIAAARVARPVEPIQPPREEPRPAEQPPSDRPGTKPTFRWRVLQEFLASISTLLFSVGMFYVGTLTPEPIRLYLAALVAVVCIGLATLLKVYKDEVDRLLRGEAWLHRIRQRYLPPEYFPFFQSVTLISVFFTVSASVQLLDYAGLQRLNDWPYWLGSRSASAEALDNIVLVKIDDKTRNSLSINRPIELRQCHSRLIEKVVRYGPPKVICFDLSFTDRSQDDDSFVQAITQQGVPVITALEYFPPDRTFLSPTPNIDMAVRNKTGHARLGKDTDRVMRLLPLVIHKQIKCEFHTDHEWYPALALQTLMWGVAGREFRSTDLIPGKEIRVATPSGVPLPPIPLDPTLRYSRDFPAGGTPVRRVTSGNAPDDITTSELCLASFQVEQFLINYPPVPFPSHSYVDVVNGRRLQNGEFSGKYVIVGLASRGFEGAEQMVNTPDGREVYPYEIHASVLYTMLSNAYIRPAHGSVATAFLIMLSLLLIFLFTGRSPSGLSVTRSAVVTVAVMFLIGVVAAGLYYTFALWIQATYAMTAVLVTGVVVIVDQKGLWPIQIKRITPEKEAAL